MAIKYKLITDKTINWLLDQMKSDFCEGFYGCQKRYVEWQYHRSFFHNDFFKDDEYTMLVAYERDKILAYDTFVPWKTICRGKEFYTHWDIIWINNSCTRGLGREILFEIRKKAELFCGYNLNQLANAAFRKAGLFVKDEIERKIAILNSDLCKILFRLDDEGNNFLELYKVPSQGKNYEIITDVSMISGKYWEDSINRFVAVSYRGKGYLKWRFVDHPYLQYSIISTDKKAEGGVAVVRFEKLKGCKYEVMRIVDLLPTLGSENQLTQAVLSFGQDRGAILADFVCSSSQYANDICMKPFIPLHEYSKYKIPYLFQPVEARERNSFNMVLGCSEKTKDIDFEKFYATKADGEIDIYRDQSGTGDINRPVE